MLLSVSLVIPRSVASQEMLILDYLNAAHIEIWEHDKVVVLSAPLTIPVGMAVYS